jgi:hypothetical protein
MPALSQKRPAVVAPAVAVMVMLVVAVIYFL